MKQGGLYKILIGMKNKAITSHAPRERGRRARDRAGDPGRSALHRALRAIKIKKTRQDKQNLRGLNHDSCYTELPCLFFVIGLFSGTAFDAERDDAL